MLFKKHGGIGTNWGILKVIPWCLLLGLNADRVIDSAQPINSLIHVTILVAWYVMYVS